MKPLDGFLPKEWLFILHYKWMLYSWKSLRNFHGTSSLKNEKWLPSADEMWKKYFISNSFSIYQRSQSLKILKTTVSLTKWTKRSNEAFFVEFYKLWGNPDGKTNDRSHFNAIRSWSTAKYYDLNLPVSLPWHIQQN